MAIEEKITITPPNRSSYFHVAHVSGPGNKHPLTKESMNNCIDWLVTQIKKNEVNAIVFDGDPYKTDLHNVAYLVNRAKEILEDEITLIALVDESCKASSKDSTYPNVDKFWEASFEKDANDRTIYGGIVNGKPRGITKTVFSESVEPDTFFIVGGGKIAADTASYVHEFPNGAIVRQVPAPLVQYEVPFTAEELEALKI